MKDTVFTFIGGGNMAEGIIRGMVSDGVFSPKQIHVFDVLPARVSFLEKEYGIVGEGSMESAERDADVLFFCIQPGAAAAVCEQVKPYLPEACVFVPICAGVSIGTFEAILGKDRKIVRVMPNTLTQTHHGVSALCRNPQVTDQDAAPVLEVLNTIGSAIEIPENMFDLFTAYGCTGPTYLFMIANAMMDAGVRAGFSRADARNMTLENMLGVALKLQMTGMHPYQILDTMSCPAGTGIEAIYTLEKEGVYGSIMHAVEMTCRHASEMG